MKKQNETTNRRQVWIDLENAEAEARKASNPDAMGAALLTAAEFTALAVLKHCESKGEKPEIMRGLRAEILTARAAREAKAEAEAEALKLTAAEAEAEALKLTAEARRIHGKRKAAEARAEAAAANLSIGDLTAAAAVAILDEIRKAREAGRIDAEAWSETPYEFTKPRRRVLIGKAAAETVTAEAAPASFAARAARREIRSNAAVKVAGGEYCYLIDEAATAEAESAIYRRIAKHDLVIDFDGGAKSAATASAADIDRLAEIETALQLTAKESEYLQLRRRNYGAKSAAASMGVSVSSAKTYTARIRAKAEKIGFTYAESPEEYNRKAEALKALATAAAKATKAAETARRYDCEAEAAEASEAAAKAAEAAAALTANETTEAKAEATAREAMTAAREAVKAAWKAAEAREAARTAETVETVTKGARALFTAAAVYAFAFWMNTKRMRRRAVKIEAEAKARRAEAEAAAKPAAEARKAARRAEAEAEAAKARREAAALVSGWKARRESEAEAAALKAESRRAASIIRAARAAVKAAPLCICMH